MKYKALRFVMKIKNVRTDHILKDCALVIDGDSYFRGSYTESGCKFILGGEFDRYADHLKRKLSVFIDSNVTCYVVFNGAMKADLERRKELHQKLIDGKMTVVPGDDNYYEPVFTKDVQKQVLEELGIKYYVCEHDSRETLHDVSKNYTCAVLTNNFEYCLLGMSCITPNSIAYDKKKKEISCKIQTPEAHKAYFGLRDNMKPILMAIFDEDGLLYRKIPQIIGNKQNPVGNVMYWINHQSQDEAIDKLAKMLNSEAERQTFRDTVQELIKLMFHCRQNSAAVKYFNQSDPSPVLYNNQGKWFKEGVSSGRIAIPYINLKNNGYFSGSWVICDKDRADAILPAIDIVMYAYSVLSYTEKNEITFIGRKSDKSCVSQIRRNVQVDASSAGTLEKKITKRKKNKRVQPQSVQDPTDLFKKFVDTALPGFDWSLLKDVPEDSWLLIISLVYYVSKSDGYFITAAYSILLSYLVLGPVSEKVGLVKFSNLSMCHSLASKDRDTEDVCTYEDCLKAAHAVIDYFYEEKIKKNFDRGILHGLAEFQHCLQQMNYLNKLCGERVKCTNYYKTYNGTLVFNVLLRMKKSEDLMVFLQSHFKGSPSVLKFYKRVKEVFDNCLSAVQK